MKILKLSIKYIQFCAVLLAMFCTLSASAQNPAIELTGVMKSGEKSVAYVDGSLYGVGERISGGYKIEEILSEGIRVSDPSGKHHYFIPVGNPSGIEKLEPESSEEQLEEADAWQGSVTYVTPSEEEEVETRKNEFQFNGKAVLGVVLLIIGLVTAVVGNIWYIVAAFMVSVWWGLGVFFVPMVELIFLFLHWEDAKKPFLTSLIGGLIALGGMLLLPGMGLQDIY